MSQRLVPNRKFNECDIGSIHSVYSTLKTLENRHNIFRKWFFAWQEAQFMWWVVKILINRKVRGHYFWIRSPCNAQRHEICEPHNHTQALGMIRHDCPCKNICTNEGFVGVRGCQDARRTATSVNLSCEIFCVIADWLPAPVKNKNCIE